MKRNLFTKSILVSVTLSALLTGCGSTSATDAGVSGDTGAKTPTNLSINGKAVDGYLQYATVCLDINQDGYCQATEPMSSTNKDGSFTLNISAEAQKDPAYNSAMLLVYGGKDVDTGADFKGKLLSPADAKEIVVSPITTLVAKAAQKEFKQDTKLTKEQRDAKLETIKESVASTLGLNVSELMKDPVAERTANPKLIKEAIKLQKKIEAVTLSGDKDAMEKLYDKLAEHLSDAQTSDDLFTEALKDDAERLKISQDIDANIEKSFTKFDGDLEKISHLVKEDMKRLKGGEKDIKRGDDDAIFAADLDWKKAYLDSALEDIGASDLTEAQKDKLKAIAEESGKEIKPGFIADIKDKIEQDDSLKDIKKALDKEKDRLERKKQADEKRHDGEVKDDLVKLFGGKTLYVFSDNEEGEDIVSSLTFSADMSSVLDPKGAKVKLEVKGNSIHTSAKDDESVLTFMTETEDAFEFFDNEGEKVMLYKTEDDASKALAAFKKGLVEVVDGTTTVDTTEGTTSNREEMKDEVKKEGDREIKKYL